MFKGWDIELGTLWWTFSSFSFFQVFDIFCKKTLPLIKEQAFPNELTKFVKLYSEVSEIAINKDLKYHIFQFFKIMDIFSKKASFNCRSTSYASNDTKKNKNLLETYWGITLQSLRSDTNSSSTRRNMSRYINTFVQIEKFVTDADSNMLPSIGMIKLRM